MRKEKVISILFTILKYASLVIASVVSLVPVCVCILTAFKTNEEYANSSVLDLPASFLNFENFVVAFKQANMLRCFFNTALYTFTGPYGNQYNYICAGVIITIIPILILFLVFQRQVYSGMAAGAVKG